MRLAVFMFFLAFAGMNHAQKAKITVDHDIVLVDNQQVFKLVSNDIPTSYILYNMLNEPLAEFSSNYTVSYVKSSNGSLELEKTAMLTTPKRSMLTSYFHLSKIAI